MSRVPVRTTARCQRNTKRIGKPAPSATARSVSNVRRRRRAAAGACFGCASAVTFWLKMVPMLLLLKLRRDELAKIDLLADLLVLEHQLRIGVGALHEHVVDFP